MNGVQQPNQNHRGRRAAEYSLPDFIMDYLEDDGDGAEWIKRDAGLFKILAIRVNSRKFNIDTDFQFFRAYGDWKHVGGAVGGATGTVPCPSQLKHLVRTAMHECKLSRELAEKMGVQEELEIFQKLDPCKNSDDQILLESNGETLDGKFVYYKFNYFEHYLERKWIREQSVEQLEQVVGTPESGYSSAPDSPENASLACCPSGSSVASLASCPLGSSVASLASCSSGSSVTSLASWPSDSAASSLMNCPPNVAFPFSPTGECNAVMMPSGIEHAGAECLSGDPLLALSPPLNSFVLSGINMEPQSVWSCSDDEMDVDWGDVNVLLEKVDIDDILQPCLDLYVPQNGLSIDLLDSCSMDSNVVSPDCGGGGKDAEPDADCWDAADSGSGSGAVPSGVTLEVWVRLFNTVIILKGFTGDTVHCHIRSEYTRQRDKSRRESSKLVISDRDCARWLPAVPHSKQRVITGYVTLMLKLLGRIHVTLDNGRITLKHDGRSVLYTRNLYTQYGRSQCHPLPAGECTPVFTCDQYLDSLHASAGQAIPGVQISVGVPFQRGHTTPLTLELTHTLSRELAHTHAHAAQLDAQMQRLTLG